MKKIEGYSLIGKSGSRTIVRDDGSVLGETFRMPGDKDWMVSRKDFRGNAFHLYFATLQQVINFLEKDH